MAETQTARFSEEQSFPQFRVRVTLALPPIFVTALAVWQLGFGHKMGRYPISNGGLIVLTALLWGVYLRLITVSLSTEIGEAEIVVRMKGFHRKRTIPLDGVRTVKIVTYDPVKDFGGYGIRKTKSGEAMVARGNRGVRLEMKDGTMVVIGSLRAEALAAAIAAARKRLGDRPKLK